MSIWTWPANVIVKLTALRYEGFYVNTGVDDGK